MARDYDNLICPHCGKRYGGSSFGSGGFGGLRGGYAETDRLRESAAAQSRNPSLTTWGGIRQRPGTGPRTTSEGTRNNGRFGMAYTEDRFGRRKYL